MASCAAGKTSRVYGQYTDLICKLMIRTWGYLFEANEKKNIKNTCEPSKIYFPFKWTLLQYIRVSSKHELDEQTRTNYEQLFVRVCSQISAN